MSGALRNSINCLDGQIGARRWRSEDHHRLGRHELLLLGHRGARSLEAGAKYGMVMTPSLSPAVGGGDEEDTGAGSGDEGRGGLQVRLQQQSLVSWRRTRALGRRKRRCSPLEKTSGGRRRAVCGTPRWPCEWGISLPFFVGETTMKERR
jgi:hypothetical protein